MNQPPVLCNNLKNTQRYLQLKRVWNLLFKSDHVILNGLKIARKENLLNPSEKLCQFIELSIGKGRRGPMPSLMSVDK